MQNERKQFFDGFLLGAVLVGLILSTIIAFFIFAQGKKAGEDVAPSFVEQSLSFFDKNEQIVPSMNENGLQTQVDGEDYFIRQSLDSGDGIIARLLSSDRENCSDTGDGILATLWGIDGKQLLHAIPLESFADERKTCVELEKWFDEKLVLTVTSETGGRQSTQVHFLSTDGMLEPGITYSSRIVPDNSLITATYQWTYMDHSFTQIQYRQNYSDLYYGDNSDPDAVLSMPVAFQTSAPLLVELTSEKNLLSYEKGIFVSQIGGEPRFIEWNASGTSF